MTFNPGTLDYGTLDQIPTADADVDDYCSVDDVRAWLASTLRTSDADLDAVLARLITASSRLIDRICGLEDGGFVARTETRVFDLLATENLYYTRDPWRTDTYEYIGYRIPTPPLLTITSLKSDEDGDGTYEVTWATTDYRLDPPSGPPYRALLVNDVTGSHTFPPGYRRVQVAGTWGVSATVPDPIRQLAVELTARKWKRADAPFAVMGSADTGLVKVGSDEKYAEEALRIAGYVDSQSWVLA